jgi:hypothetical protein
VFPTGLYRSGFTRTEVSCLFFDYDGQFTSEALERFRHRVNVLWRRGGVGVKPVEKDGSVSGAFFGHL